MANNIDKKEPVAICDQSKIDVTKCDNHELAGNIEPLIKVIRGQQVMLDKDLAMLYGVEAKVLNQAVKRNVVHIMLIFLLQLILSCNPQKTNDGISSKDILYGEWALVDGEHQVNYPNIEFFADSSAILYSQADTIYRFTFYTRNDTLFLVDVYGKRYVNRIKKLTNNTIVFDGIADVDKEQTYKR